MKTRPKTLALVGLLAIVAIFAACGGGGDDSEDEPDPTDSTSSGLTADNYDVTMTEDSAMVDEATMDESFIEMSDDGRTLRFEEGSEAIENLEEGVPTIFAGQALGVVTDISEDDGEIVVETEEATLDQVIEDGEISWSYAIDWDEVDYSAFIEPAKAVGLHPVQQESSLKFSGTIKGFDVEFELKPGENGRLDIGVEAKKGENLAVSGEGYVSGFTQETFINYEDSVAGEVTSESIGLESEMELKWAAFTIGAEGITEIASMSIPVELPIRFLIGPIPVRLSIKAVLQVVPELNVEGASSGGSWKVKYNSDQGFEVEDTLHNPVGQLIDSVIEVSDETVSAGFGPVGFGLGIEFPRLEVALFESAVAFITIKTYSTSLWTPGTTLTNDIPPCQKGSTTITAVAGYSVSFLGIAAVESQEQVWQDFLEKFLNDEPCDLTGGQ